MSVNKGTTVSVPYLVFKGRAVEARMRGNLKGEIEAAKLMAQVQVSELRRISGMAYAKARRLDRGDRVSRVNRHVCEQWRMIGRRHLIASNQILSSVARLS